MKPGVCSTCDRGGPASRLHTALHLRRRRASPRPAPPRRRPACLLVLPKGLAEHASSPGRTATPPCFYHKGQHIPQPARPLVAAPPRTAGGDGGGGGGGGTHLARCLQTVAPVALISAGSHARDGRAWGRHGGCRSSCHSLRAQHATPGASACPHKLRQRSRALSSGASGETGAPGARNSCCWGAQHDWRLEACEALTTVWKDAAETKAPF